MGRDAKFRVLFDKPCLGYNESMNGPYTPYWYYFEAGESVDPFRLDWSTCGLFTGLQDKSGKDIFEGDLLRNESGRICVVKWHEFAGWDCEPAVIVNNDNSEGFKLVFWSRSLEKIGDIYTTPELIRGKS